MAGEKRFEIYSTSKSLIKILLLRIVEQVKKKKKTRGYYSFGEINRCFLSNNIFYLLHIPVNRNEQKKS